MTPEESETGRGRKVQDSTSDDAEKLGVPNGKVLKVESGKHNGGGG
jgi:hypothetical protein